MIFHVTSDESPPVATRCQLAAEKNADHGTQSCSLKGVRRRGPQRSRNSTQARLLADTGRRLASNLFRPYAINSLTTLP